MRAVNLLPRDTAKQRKLTQQNLPVVVGAGLGVLVTAALALENGRSIGGTTYSHESVARLLSRLALVPELNNIVLASSTAGGGGSGPTTTTGTGGSSTPAPVAPVTVSFSITAKVALPAG